ncbi:hypothetical protein D3C72_2007310 [compost metagenome]
MIPLATDADSVFDDVMAALADAQQDLECFRAKTEPESLGYGAKWKQNALVAREERDALRDELSEAQQTIARQREALEEVAEKSLYYLRSVALKALQVEEGDTQL